MNMCEVSHCESNTHKFAKISVLPAQVQNRAGQKYRVPHKETYVDIVGIVRKVFSRQTNLSQLIRVKP